MSNETKIGQRICVAPWNGFNLDPRGGVFPCCHFTFDKPVGNLKQQSLEDILHGPILKKVREQMLKGEDVPQCENCYRLEDMGAGTLRQYLNAKFPKTYLEIEEQAQQGVVASPRIEVFDIQFSNFCNLKCRMCGPEYSTSWVKENAKFAPEKHGEVSILEKDIESFWQQMEPLAETSEEVYFWGGEPLLMEEHYRFLKMLIEKKRFDVTLRYNSNFTSLQYKGEKVTDLWKHFKTIHFSASLDGMGPRAELLRKGCHWEAIVKNRKILAEEAPHVNFHIACAVSSMNIEHFIEFQTTMVEDGWVRMENFCTNLVQAPLCYKIQVLPLEQKERLYQQLQNHIETFVRPRDNAEKTSENRITAIMNFMMAKDESEWLSDFFLRTEDLDSRRGENFWQVFPELEYLQKLKKSNQPTQFALHTP